MTQENRISLNIPAEDIEAIKAATKVLQEKLLPHLATLTKEEQGELFKIGDKSIAFINRSFEYIEQNPKLTPDYINVEEMKVDIGAVETLRKILNPIGLIVSALDDSIMLSGSEANVPALAFYNYIKGAARMNVPGAKAIYDDLKKYFAKRSHKKKSSSNNSNEGNNA